MKIVVLLLGIIIVVVMGIWAMEGFTDYIMDNRRLEEESTVPKRYKENWKQKFRRWFRVRKRK